VAVCCAVYILEVMIGVVSIWGEEHDPLNSKRIITDVCLKMTNFPWFGHRIVFYCSACVRYSIGGCKNSVTVSPFFVLSILSKKRKWMHFSFTGLSVKRKYR